MSTRFPRRLKDLPSLDGEEDSPAPKFRGSSTEANNKKQKNDNQNLTSNTSNTSQLLPKRSSELPKLDSSSSSDDLEDSLKNSNLHNCAILNNSFCLSPCNNEQNADLPIETPAGKLLRHIGEEEEEQQQQNEDGNDNLSFVNRFNKMDLNKSVEPVAEISTKQTNVNTKLEIIEENEKQELEDEEENKEEIEDKLPEMPTTCSKRKVPNTPYDNNKKLPPSTQKSMHHIEGQFVTPQVRSFSVQRRPRDLCSTQSSKSRTALANEFRTQKVLFQTPITLSRAPLNLPNDSVTLSLFDESGCTPSTAEKSPQKVLPKDASTKTKKSLESAFSAVNNEAEKENNESSQNSQSQSQQTIAKQPESILKRTNSTTRQTSVTINDSEYEVIKKLGCGGSSSVYLAQRKENGKEYALKVVDLQGDPVIIEGYMNETKLLAKLQGNISVVGLYDYQLLRKESKLFLVMEKGDSDLQKILQGYTTNLPLYVLMNYLYQMLQAVNYIHQNGVIHSDLKPANFLMVNGRLKLIDFGIASNIATDSTSIIKFSQAGTFNYISPEALTDTSTGTSPIRRNQPKIKISTKSDVWSLGCILYLFLYQKTPFSHIKNIYAKINAISSPTTVVSYSEIPTYYPNMLVHMVKNCLKHNPKQRPSCAELLQYPFHMIIPIQHLIVPTSRSSNVPKQTPL